MPTSLSDQLFSVDEPLADQLFSTPAYTFDPTPESEPWLEHIRVAEAKYGLPENMLLKMIDTESKFDPKAKSKAGAIGIAQIIPKYHPGIDPTDPVASIDYAASYVKKNYKRFGSWQMSRAAYNMGPTALAKYGMGELPGETKDYVKKTDPDITVPPAESLTDLLYPKPEAPDVIEPAVKEPVTDAEKFYGAGFGVIPPLQPLVPMVVTPETTAYMGRHGYGPRPEGGWREDGMPLDKDGNPYYQAEKATGVIAETLQGITALATHPLEVIRGGLDFITSVPGFLTGLVAAAGGVGREIVHGVAYPETEMTLESLYDVAAEKLQGTMEALEPLKRPIVGELTPESQLMTQTIMAPMSAMSALGHGAAGYEGFKDSPNIRGAYKFVGDVLGLGLMGFLLHGGGRRARFSKRVEEVVKEAEEVRVSEQAAGEVPNEILKQAELKVVAAKKAQTELKAKEIMKEFSEDLAIREELGRQAEEVAKGKMRPVADTGLKKPTPTQVRAVMDKLPEGVEPDFTFESTKGNVYVKAGEEWYDSEGVPVTNVWVKRAAEKGKISPSEAKVTPVTHRAVPVKDFTDPYSDKPVTHLRIQSYPAGYEQLSKEIFTGAKVSRKTTVEGDRIIPPGKITPFTETKMVVLEPYWIEGKNIKGDWVEIQRFNDLKAAEEGLERFAGKKLKPKAEPVLEPAPEVITEVDKAIGETIQFEGERSPFFQDAETTETFKNIYAERAKAAMEDPEIFMQKLINDANRWYHGEDVPIDTVRDNLSRLSSMADDLRMDFLTGEDHAIWKETLGEAAEWARKLDRLEIEPTEKMPTTLEGLLERIKASKEPTDPDTTLYAGISPREVIKSARGVMEYMKEARGMKAFRPREAAKMTREEFTTAVVDRSGNIRKDFLDRLGDEGYRIVQKMVLTKGASSLSAKNLKQMSKEVYHGKSKDIKLIQDAVILSDRMIDIAKYKTPKQFKFPRPIEDFVRFRQAYRYKAVNGLKDLTDAEFKSVESGNKAYYAWMKKALKDLLDAELISLEDYGRLAVHNYRRIKLVDIYDKQYKTKIGKKPMTVYDSGVESLARGRETDIYEPSSEIMALEVFNRTYGRILNNKANQSLLDLARRDPVNPYVRVKENKGDSIPSGWNRVFVFEKGERKPIYLSPEMSKEWINSSPDISYRMGQLIRYVSGAPILRLFATGINWGFAVANLPRDVMHIWYAARVFEKGQWQPLYSSHAPIYGIQMARDLATVASDAVLRKGRTDAYYEDGGGMEFLVHQGRIFQRGRHIKGPIDVPLNFMGYFGETTELAPRLAIRERVIRRRAKERGISVDEARKIQEIRDEATFAARDYMDFGQGGWATKAADNGIPYLSAAIQGTRGMFRAFKDNPYKSSYKLAQFATAISGLYIGMKKMHPKSSEALQGNIDMQNNICIPLGDQFGFEDEMGQMRYPYIKIPLDPSQKFFKTFFEAATDKWLGNEIDINRVVDSLKEQSPVGVTELPPAISGVLGYMTNKDFWLNEDIWRKTDKPFGFPQSKEEYVPGYTPEFYEDLGEKTGLSPERTKYMVEELTTKGTMWSYILGEGYKALFGDSPKELNEQHLAMALTEKPIIRRFFGVTHPYSQHAQPIEKAKEDSDIDRWIQNRGLDARVDGYLYHDNVKSKEIIDYMKSFKDMKVFDRLRDRYKFQVDIKGLPNRSFWLRLRGLTTEARAKVYYHRFESLSVEERRQMMRELGTVIKAGGVITPEFRREVAKLQAQ